MGTDEITNLSGQDVDSASAALPLWLIDSPDHAQLANQAPSWEQRRALESLSSFTETGGGELTDREVLDVIVAWQKQAASAHAQLLTWINVLSHRSRMARNSPTITSAQATAAELQFALATTKRRATTLVTDAHHLTGTLWPVHEALTHGAIDPVKASLFVEILAEQSLPAQITVTEQALPAAPDLDHSALRRRLCDLLVECDPDGVTTRTRAAVERRRVNRPRPAGDGMAFFTAYLPAPAAAALDLACEAAARATRAAGDPRTLDQLRADTLTTLAEHALISGQVGAPGITAETLTFDATHARVHLDASPRAQRGERGPCPADAVDWELSTPAGQRGEPNPYEGDPHEGGADEESAPGPVPYLHGFGAIPPALVPALAAQPWIQVHTPTPPGAEPPPAPGYRPTADLDRYVRTRDVTCQAPGCNVSAWLCDLDHVLPYPAGATTAANLRALCRHHHRLKTLGGHSYLIEPDGTLRWSTPTGHILRRDHEGNTHLPGLTDHTTGPDDLELPPTDLEVPPTGLEFPPGDLMLRT